MATETHFVPLRQRHGRCHLAEGVNPMPSPHDPRQSPLLHSRRSLFPFSHHTYTWHSQPVSRPSLSSLPPGLPSSSPHSRPPPHSSHHPCTADPALSVQLAHLQTLGVAPSTRRTYQAGITQFQRFCSNYNLHPLPASALTLRYFAAHLSTSVKHSTIKLYLSALRLFHIECGYPDPTGDTLLHYVIKGVKRCQSTATKPRLPITIHTLKDLKRALHNAPSLPTHDKRMLWAAFCTAFYGFLRASEFCTPSASTYSTTTCLCRADLSFTPSSARLLVKLIRSERPAQSPLASPTPQPALSLHYTNTSSTPAHHPTHPSSSSTTGPSLRALLSLTTSALSSEELV